MTYEEVIENLVMIKESLRIFGIIDCGEAEVLDLAIKGLEKQIPKKVGKEDCVSYGTPYYCPECEAYQTPVEFFSLDGSEPKEKVSYCWKCGQAIDWSE